MELSEKENTLLEKIKKEKKILLRELNNSEVGVLGRLKSQGLIEFGREIIGSGIGNSPSYGEKYVAIKESE